MADNLEILRDRYEELLQKRIYLEQQIDVAERELKAIDQELAFITQRLWQFTGVVASNS